MMKASFLLAAIGCLIHYAHAQAGVLVDSINSRGVSYGIYEWEGASTDVSSDPDPCPWNNILAFWDSADDYRAFIDEMIDEGVATGEYNIGLGNEGVYIRTLGGGRLAPFVNFWEAEADRNADACAYMIFDDTTDADAGYYRSPWKISEAACDLKDTDTYICMARSDPSCTEDCSGEGKDRTGEYCFWNPTPGVPCKYAEAVDICKKNGGELMSLLDAGDINELEKLHVAPYDEQQQYNHFFINVVQYPGESHPRLNGTHLIDAHGVWRESPNYGSTLNSVPYVGLYGGDARSGGAWGDSNRGLDMYMISQPTYSLGDNFLDYRQDGFRISIEAFVACEATRDNFCLTNSPEVRNAHKSIVSYNHVRYTCREGYEFVDHTTERDFSCSCDLNHYSALDVEHCILKNPCKADADLCKPHGYCIFTNEYLRPYYCLCKKGYEWDVLKKECVDIDECAEGDPCGYYYGHCINTQGAYWCQCKQGYGWDNNGHCTSYPGYPSQPHQPVLHTMAIYFHVNMNYHPDMNLPNTEVHNDLRAALDELTGYIYGGHQVSVDSFYIAGEQYGNMKIKVVFNIYIQADVTELSVYAWKFYNYVTTNTRYFTVKSNTYPYYGSVYFESTKFTKQITITSACSIFNAIDQCHGSVCEADGYKPACVCREGYYGDFCQDTKIIPVPPRHETLNSAEIGLIIAVVILFICVICITICLCCCLVPGCRSCGCYQAYGRSARPVAPVYGTSGAGYVSRGPVIRRGYPKFV